MQGWSELQQSLAEIARRQIFFVGGAPRSGTTWLQQMLDAHPDVCCQGEGLFLTQLAEPLDALMAQRRQALEAKNTTLFRHTGGYRLPTAEDADFLLASAILLALGQQSRATACHAIGEKTPENVFFFARLKHLFPAAKFIGVARDPRDVLTSAWHFFHTVPPGMDDVPARMAFIQRALPSLDQGARTMIAASTQYPADYRVVTYERLQRAPAAELAALFGFLGVADDAATVAGCVASTSFAAQTARHGASVGGRAFLRKGVVGDWASTLTPAMNALVLRDLGWMFPHFGWDAALADRSSVS